ncbi:hypothetical protein DV737_g4651, partial [Chaetothyriales sp. CBS 132003]
MAVQQVPRSGSPAFSLIALTEYIINSFIPGAQPLLTKYPTLYRTLGFLLAFWYLEPAARLQALWSRISTLVVATVAVTSDEDLFGYMSAYLYERKTLRADQKLNAISNPMQEQNFMRGHRELAEESAKGAKQEPKIKYERSRGTEFFVHKRRLFWASRAEGEGHQYFGNRYKRAEVLSVSCLGRSTEPVKELMEEVFRAHKDKEKTLTIIRRPHTGGYSSHLSWSRLTSKPRRALGTVVLEASQKSSVVADMQEYMDESTAAFYGSHGIPYRRGYMFYGPPGTGKTSFALALASKFNMDVYVLSLLDQALTDSDLISLFNQLPGRSLLLLEDIDTAGLSKRKAVSAPCRNPLTVRRSGRAPDRQSQLPMGGSGLNKVPRSRVSLSGLLNAVDGVAAPEGHILIITTNKPYNLDEALVRAGRISVRVAFSNATKTQARELFTRMYVDADLLTHTKASAAVDKKKKKPGGADGDRAVADGISSGSGTITLDLLANEFAASVPEQEYSPADLQDYLLGYKKDPIGAINGVSQWMAEQAEERERREAEIQGEREKRRKKKSAQDKEWVESIKSIVKETKEKGEGKKKESTDTGTKEGTDTGAKEGTDTDAKEGTDTDAKEGNANEKTWNGHANTAADTNAPSEEDGQQN